MTFDRRTLLQAIAGGSALSPLGALSSGPARAADAPAAMDPNAAHMKLMEVPGMHMHGGETIAMLVYPGYTALDFVGPHHFLASMMGARVQIVTNQPTLAPVVSDLGLSITPTHTFEDATDAPTLVFTPGGGAGTIAAMQHGPTLEFFRSRASRAQYVTSVCTGALILAAAGLLKGRRATTHWAAHEILADFGATPVEARVVTDGAFITGAGVSAGLDFALTVVEKLRGRPYAQALMLQAEYAPQPPFPGGTVKTTDPAIAEPLRGMLSPIAIQARAIAHRT